MPFPRLDASSAVHSRSPSRSLPDAVIRAFSSSLTTTVFSQRSMRRFDTSPRRAAPKGQTFISCTAPRSITQLPSNLPRSWHTPVAQRPLVDPKVASDLGDGLAGLEHHLHGLSLELRAEPPPRLWHGQILSAQSHCPRSLVHPRTSLGDVGVVLDVVRGVVERLPHLRRPLGGCGSRHRL